MEEVEGSPDAPMMSVESPPAPGAPGVPDDATVAKTAAELLDGDAEDREVAQAYDDGTLTLRALTAAVAARLGAPADAYEALKPAARRALHDRVARDAPEPEPAISTRSRRSLATKSYAEDAVDDDEEDEEEEEEEEPAEEPAPMEEEAPAEEPAPAAEPAPAEAAPAAPMDEDAPAPEAAPMDEDEEEDEDDGEPDPNVRYRPPDRPRLSEDEERDLAKLAPVVLRIRNDAEYVRGLQENTELWLKAAHHGNVEALVRLGLIPPVEKYTPENSEKVNGVTKLKVDLAKGRAALVESATDGDGRSRYVLGLCRRDGLLGFDVDFAGAVAAWRAAADAGHLVCMLLAAKALERGGDGVDADRRAAYHYYCRASEYGDDEAEAGIRRIGAAGDAKLERISLLVPKSAAAVKAAEAEREKLRAAAAAEELAAAAAPAAAAAAPAARKGPPPPRQSYYEVPAARDDGAAAAPPAAPEASAAPEAEDHADGEAEWRTEGPYVGQWVTRAVIGDVSTLSVGRVAGYLSKDESDYEDPFGKPAALWKIEYLSGALKGDAEDIEEFQVIQSHPSDDVPPGFEMPKDA